MKAILMESKQRGALYSLLLTILIIFIGPRLQGQESAEELAKKLSNPVASLVSFPLQSNLDYGIGPHNGSRYTINIQPVIPFPLSSRLNLITRFILPLMFQRDITGEGTRQDGLSDLTASFFFAPVNSKSGVIWGAGPAFLIPTATNDLLGTKKWGLGPTALVLRQTKGWTYGFLANQIWSIAGDENRPDVNQLFLQPFIAYNWKSGAGLTVNSEMTQNWEAETTTTFLNVTVSGVTKLGKQTISLAVGPRVPLGGALESRPDMGLRAVITLVFPK